MAESTATEVDAEIRRLIDANYARCKKALQDNMDKLHRLAEGLLEHETLDQQQIDDLLAGKVVVMKKASRYGRDKDKSATAKAEPKVEAAVGGEAGDAAAKPAKKTAKSKKTDA